MKQKSKIIKFFRGLGPGVVTGAADDDPSGIVTYSQTGAKYGYGLLWVAIFMLPLMIAVQEMSARIGVVTGKGIARNIKEHYSKPVLFFIVALLLIANTINLGADLGAMAEAARLIVDWPFTALAVIFCLIILLLEVTIPYHKYARILKWLTLSLFAYILTGLIIEKSWREIAIATFVPHWENSFEYLFLIVGLLGTTISPYMFFWQASQEVEEREDHIDANHRMPRVTDRYLANMRLDTFTGMIFSELVAWFIIVTTGTVLFSNGVNDIESAAQAAQALEPLVHGFPYAGELSKVLFAAGIIGTGFLAIPIFAACSSYAISELFGWNEGLSNKFKQARGFYGVIIGGTVVGLLLNMLGFDPIRMLIYTAVMNGIIAVPIIFMLLRISNSKKIMGHRRNGLWSNLFSGIAFLAMAISAGLIIYNYFFM
jgi:NRAMP (natural resistance-associated macrophage protein)-like metal ion transporter